MLAVLKIFSDVRAGETGVVLMLFTSIFLVLTGYYVLKVVREGLILVTGGAELKAYASAAQAGVLIGVIALYGWLGKRVARLRLVIGLGVAYALIIEAFALSAIVSVPLLGFAFYVFVGGQLTAVVLEVRGVPMLGFAFYVFVGIFSVSVIAQFWSYANDLFTREMGGRLFPVVMIGASLGAIAGSWIPGRLAGLDLNLALLLQVPVVLLILHLVLYGLIERAWTRMSAPAEVVADPETRAEGESPSSALREGNGFLMIARSKYLTLVALLLVLLNLVNTTGEFLLATSAETVVGQWVANGEVSDPGQGFDTFYSDFFFWVNIASLTIQALLVSRIVKFTGMVGALFVLPCIALGVYGLGAAGVAASTFALAKMAENSTDYSLMNTTRALLWRVTTREEKYVAKQTTDTFIVRIGDVLSAGLVFVGTTWLALSPQGFAAVNVVLVIVWLALAWLLLREYRRLKAVRDAESASPGTASLGATTEAAT